MILEYTIIECLSMMIDENLNRNRKKLDKILKGFDVAPNRSHYRRTIPGLAPDRSHFLKQQNCAAQNELGNAVFLFPAGIGPFTG